MRKGIMGLVVIACLILSGFAAAGIASAKEVKLTIWAIGPDNPSFWRAKAFNVAIDRLNKILGATGSDVKIVGNVSFETVSWGDYRTRALLAFKSGKGPDIYTTGHEDIGMLADAGYIIPLDKYINKYKWYFDSFFPNLWNSVKLKGKIYGIPQDTEARMIYIRKDALKKMGWSDEKIKKFIEAGWKGEITLEDILKVGAEAKKKGIVKWGFYHRPTPGVDYFQIYLAYGGRMWDPDTGKLVLSEKAALETLKFFYDAVNTYKITPSGMTSVSWKSIHKAVVNGDVLFWLGGSWNWAEWQRDYNASEDYLFKNIAFIPIPPGKKGGKPVTISHPVVYMVSSTCKNPDLAVALIGMALAPDLNTKHAVTSGHLAISYKQLGLPEYNKAKFLSMVTPLLKFTRFAPNHPKFNTYNKEGWYKAIQMVEVNGAKPEKALSFLKSILKRKLKGALTIEP